MLDLDRSFQEVKTQKRVDESKVGSSSRDAVQVGVLRELLEVHRQLLHVIDALYDDLRLTRDCVWRIELVVASRHRISSLLRELLDVGDEDQFLLANVLEAISDEHPFVDVELFRRQYQHQVQELASRKYKRWS